MKARFLSLILMVLALSLVSTAQAGPYIELSGGLVFVDAPADTAYPPLADLRVGIEQPGRQYELALMSSPTDDRLNQLRVDTPAIVSLLYHHIPQTTSSLKLHLIVGASWVDVETTHPVAGKSSETFSGISYGLGVEEHFQTIPRLKLSLDLLQLYLGDNLDIYSFSLGAHYEF